MRSVLTRSPKINSWLRSIAKINGSANPKFRSTVFSVAFEFNFRSSNVEVAHTTTTDFDEWLHTPKALTVGGAVVLEYGRSLLAGNSYLSTTTKC